MSDLVSRRVCQYCTFFLSSSAYVSFFFFFFGFLLVFAEAGILAVSRQSLKKTFVIRDFDRPSVIKNREFCFALL